MNITQKELETIRTLMRRAKDDNLNSVVLALDDCLVEISPIILKPGDLLLSNSPQKAPNTFIPRPKE